MLFKGHTKKSLTFSHRSNICKKKLWSFTLLPPRFLYYLIKMWFLEGKWKAQIIFRIDGVTVLFLMYRRNEHLASYKPVDKESVVVAITNTLSLSSQLILASPWITACIPSQGALDYGFKFILANYLAFLRVPRKYTCGHCLQLTNQNTHKRRRRSKHKTYESASESDDMAAQESTDEEREEDSADMSVCR